MIGLLKQTRLLVLSAAVALGCGYVCADTVKPADAPINRYEPVPEKFRNNTDKVAIKERLGQAIKTNLTFTDSNGQPVVFSDYFNKGRPVVLQMGYFRCPQICDIVSGALVGTARKVDDLTIGKDYDVIFVSIDPTEKWTLAQEKKRNYVQEYDRSAGVNGFHFLIGEQSQIASLADEIGFKYQKVEGLNEFAHPTMLTVFTPEGKVSRYLYGVEYSDRTLRMALVEAGQGKIGNAVDQIVMMCYHWNEYAGMYTKDWMAIMRLGGAVSVLILGSFIGLMLYREKRFRRTHKILTV